MTETQLSQVQEWTVANAIRERAAVTPKAAFLVGDGEEPDLTYGEALRSAEEIARRLVGLGISRGDRVGMMAPNSRRSVLIWLALALVGAVDVWLNPALRGSSLAHVLNTARPRLMFAASSSVTALRAVESPFEIEPGIVVLDEMGEGAEAWPAFLALPVGELRGGPAFSDLASIIYTSGTTGLPKGAMLPHAQAYLEGLSTARQFDLAEDDVFLVAHPMYHIAGKYMAVLTSIIAGCRVVLRDRFDAATWLDDIRANGVTATISHGPLTEMIFRTPERPDDRDNPLRRMSSAPIPAGIADRFAERFGVHMMELWGMTEVDNPIWQPKTERHRIGSCGRVNEEWFEVLLADPMTDLPVPLGETGEILVRGKLPFTIFQGYVDSPEATVAVYRNGWFHSGDFARMDEEGYVYFVDRSSERIRRRAENVSSYEIEMAALRLPQIALAAAVGVPSGLSGDDDVKLCLVAVEGESIDEVAVLTALLRDLPPSLVPRYIEVLDEFPRTPATGKIQKSQLKYLDPRRVWDRRAAGVELRRLAREGADR